MQDKSPNELLDFDASQAPPTKLTLFDVIFHGAAVPHGLTIEQLDFDPDEVTAVLTIIDAIFDDIADRTRLTKGQFRNDALERAGLGALIHTVRDLTQGDEVKAFAPSNTLTPQPA